MISGRTFAREMIALRQRETKRAGRILALQGQNPGQLELRTHSEFGANLSVTPGALPSSVLELSLEEAVQPDIILSGSALRKQNHSISFSSQRCQPPGTEDSGGGFRGTGHGPLRPLIVSNLKWGEPCRRHYVFPAGRYQNLPQFFKKPIEDISYFSYTEALIGLDKVRPHT